MINKKVLSLDDQQKSLSSDDQKKSLSSGDTKTCSKREGHNVIMIYGISIAKGAEWAWLRPAATGDAQGDTAVAAASGCEASTTSFVYLNLF